jgi:hypothetical protein
MKKKKHGPCWARTSDRRIMRKVSGGAQATSGLASAGRSSTRQASTDTFGTRPKRDQQPTIRPTNQRRKRLIHDITSRSLRR